MTKLTQLVGIIKDKASQSKAALLSQRTTLSLLRATTHDFNAAPTPKHLHTLLSDADGSRATASAALELLMHRLHATNNAAVALKCLIAVHYIFRHGTFILQDQLSVYPSTGGRNYLNLSNFRHVSDSVSWELSSWVRWLAQHMENLLCSSRILGFFIGNCPKDREERVSGLMNGELLSEFESLVTVVEGVCKMPDIGGLTKGNKVVDEILRLGREDWAEVVWEVGVAVAEFKERIKGGLKFGERVELVCCLKRLEECREKVMSVVVAGKEERLWDCVAELKDETGKMYSEEEEEKRGNNKLQEKEVRKIRFSESDRFSRSRILSSDDELLQFPSGRFL
ncbi:hypothetical protein PIB30_017069 [Stylosanthes scabra]|uniref:ENTH domain-containing protein n=1 Tax=Stylosanthes scabra TaxID=79078 RepID=A0ABU6S6Y8_9FABA|nr:hypothetical protein [Stylosanthes scabra]